MKENKILILASEHYPNRKISAGERRIIFKNINWTTWTTEIILMIKTASYFES